MGIFRPHILGMERSHPDFVTRDQHRADMAELRLELKDELHGVRQDLAVLMKTVDMMQQTVVIE
jgi:hypothetical protein